MLLRPHVNRCRLIRATQSESVLKSIAHVTYCRGPAKVGGTRSEHKLARAKPLLYGACWQSRSAICAGGSQVVTTQIMVEVDYRFERHEGNRSVSELSALDWQLQNLT